MYYAKGKTLVKLFLSIAFFFWLAQPSAQNYDHQYIHHTYTQADGLPNNAVFRITQDKFGFIWLATWDGLTRFDGFMFKNFRHDPNEPATLPYFYPNEVCTDALGNLWVTAQSISRLDPESEEFITYSPGSKHYRSLNRIYSSTVDNAGQFYILGPNGISKYNCEKDGFDDIQTIYQLNNAQNSIKGDLLVDNQHFWVVDYINRRILIGKLDSTLNGVPRIGFNQSVLFPFTSVKSGNFIQEVHFHGLPNGDYVIASNLGLFYVDMKKYQAKRLFHVPDSMLQGLGHDIVWSSVEEGLFLYKSQIKKVLHFPKKFTNRVNNAFLDDAGDIWFGSFSESGAGTGLNQIILRKSPWTHLSLDIYKTSEFVSVFALFEDIKTKDVYIGTNNFPQLLRLGTDNKIGIINLPYVEDGLRPRTISQDITGSVWIGTREGYLFRSDEFKRGFKQIYPVLNKLAGERPYHSIKILKSLPTQGMLAAGHSGIAIFNINDNHIDKEYLNKTGEGDLYSCYVDTHGTLWAGGCGELFEFSAEMKVRNKTTIGSGLYNIEDIVAAGDSGLWLALLGGGICFYHFKSGDQKIYSSHDGLKNNVVYCILRDRKNNLWLSTNDGLSLFNVLNKQFVNYGSDDGLNIQEFNSDACLMRSDGSMVFGGMGGIVVFNPDSVGITRNLISPILLFTEILSHNAGKDCIWHICGKRSQTLEKGIKNIRMVFSHVSYHNQQNSRFRYRLKGYKEEWDMVPVGARFIDFTGLNPGSYDVILYVSGNKGQWELETSLEIIIPPFFYETLWFKSLVVILILTVVALIIYLRLRQLSLLHEHRISCLKQLALQQQQNPHFISNSLQAIEALSANGDEMATNEYISRLYTLMRRMIDYTGKEFIPMSDETEIVNSFLKVEQIRIGFEFEIQNSVCDEGLEIAPSFIQPILENAIKHGIIARMDNGGKIIVKFLKLNNHSITCQVEDNGPGYHLNESKTKNTSRGLINIRQRLQIYQSLNKRKYHFTISSKGGNDAFPGTIVTIDIPTRDTEPWKKSGR